MMALASYKLSVMKKDTKNSLSIHSVVSEDENCDSDGSSSKARMYRVMFNDLVRHRGPPMPVFSKTCICFLGLTSYLFVLFLYLSQMVPKKNEIDLNDGDWTTLINRDVGVYIIPNKNTFIHEPKNAICADTYNINEKLFVLIFVQSAIDNFERRNLIRETWGNFNHYLKASILFNHVKDISKKTNTDLNNIEVKLDKKDNDKIYDDIPDFKVVFVVGLAHYGLFSDEIQYKLDQEVETHDDIIQEAFLDTKSNLTLKSVMMLKWIVTKCRDSVRYIFKADEDVFVNVPNLIQNLKRRAQKFESSRLPGQKEYLLLGSLVRDTEGPERDPKYDFYVPYHMYSGSLYPRYLSGSGYAMSTPAAAALYKAALITPYLNVDDVYITGLCPLRSVPRLTPQHDQQFSPVFAVSLYSCAWYTYITSTEADFMETLNIQSRMLNANFVEQCEKGIQRYETIIPELLIKTKKRWNKNLPVFPSELKPEDLIAVLE